MLAAMESELQGWDALAALDWQIEMGADEAILDAPVDRYALDAKPAKAAPAAPQARPAPAAEPDPAEQARALAEAAADLPALHQALAGFTGSPLREGARNCVFSDGHAGAHVLILGEAPGREEDREGRPFVGRAGQLLDRMFAPIGLSRRETAPEKSLYITNVLPWRPEQNRTPTDAEIALFLPFVARHIALARPRIIVTMGNTPCKALLGRSGITRLHGEWAEAMGCPVLPMFHPAYLLRRPEEKAKAWADLLSLKARLAKEIP